MAKTVYQRIIDREIPAKIEHEDSECIVIHDIEPQAPIHLLIIPKWAISRLSEAEPEDQALLGHLMLTAQAMSKKLKMAAGFRLVMNNGMFGGESVAHLHMHMLGGRQLSWPPG